MEQQRGGSLGASSSRDREAEWKLQTSVPSRARRLSHLAGTGADVHPPDRVGSGGAGPGDADMSRLLGGRRHSAVGRSTLWGGVEGDAAANRCLGCQTGGPGGVVTQALEFHC
jgi:hypothetical protein